MDHPDPRHGGAGAPSRLECDQTSARAICSRNFGARNSSRPKFRNSTTATIAISTILSWHTRRWKWQKGFKIDPPTKERTNTQPRPHLPTAAEAADAVKQSREHSSTAQQAQHAGQTEPGAQVSTNENVATYDEEGICGIAFARIMAVVEAAHYYSSYLTEQDMLYLIIPRGLNMSEVEPGLATSPPLPTNLHRN